MTDFFKKAFYISLGMASLGKAKMEEFARDYANISQQSEAEGKKVYEDLTKGAKEAREEIEKNIKEETEKVTSRFNRKINERMDALEARIQALENKLKSE
jgi:polyhydroxyalkanoate synthesis regulator phasin